MQELTDQGFNSAIGDGVTLVCFSAAWCKPCAAFKVTLHQYAKTESAPPLFVADIDVCPLSARAYGIKGVPSLVMFRDGVQVASTGALPLAKLVQWVRDRGAK